MSKVTRRVVSKAKAHGSKARAAAMDASLSGNNKKPATSETSGTTQEPRQRRSTLLK
jgi:hypothetical protein